MSGIVVNQHTNIGFYKAPVCKSLVLLIGSTHAATHVPALEPIFRKIFSVQRLDGGSSLWKVLCSKFIFPDTGSAVIACILLHFFRIFERRYGSLRFSSNILSTFLLTVSLELVFDYFLDVRSYGPLGIIMPLFVPCFLEIPVLAASRFGPLAISSKSFNYLLGLQLMFASPHSPVATISSILAGILIYCTRLKRMMLPSWVGRLIGATWGRIVSSSPPESSGLLGATLEIQRSQQAEAIEQQLLRARNRYNVPIGGRQMRLNEMWGGMRRGRGREEAAGGAVVPSPMLVQTLTDMGFPRQRVEQVLQQANNDLDMATNLLLQEM